MNDQNTVETQFNKDFPTSLQRTACGLTSLYNAINYLVGTRDDLTTLATEYIGMGQYNVPTYAASFKHFLNGLPIPILFSTDKNPNTIDDAQKMLKNLNERDEYKIVRIDKPDLTPQRAFTLKDGFDHRGISNYLQRKRYPLVSELFENQPLPLKLEMGSCILASVHHNDLGYPAHLKILSQHITTHVICIYAIEQIGDSTSVSFIDPAYTTPQDQIQIRSLESLNQAFADKYSLLKTKQY